MSVVRRLVSRVRGLIGGRRSERDLHQEIEGHLAEAIEEYLRRGLPPAEAQAAARRDFGGVLQVTEAHRDVRRGSIVRQVDVSLQDVRYALRTCRHQPLFTLGVVSILALGIGLVTSILSLVNAQFFRPWQVSDPNSMAVIRARPASGEPLGAISIEEFRYLREHSQAIPKMAAWHSAESRVQIGGEERHVVSAFVSADYFTALGIGMLAGRGFTADEVDDGTPKAVAIISHYFWQQHLNLDPGIVGRTIRVDNKPFQVVGVVAQGFGGVQGGSYRTDLWLPLHTLQYMDIVAGRLRRGTPRSTAAAELTVLSNQFRRSASAAPHDLVVVDTRPTNVYGAPIPAGQFRTYSLCLFAAAMVLLLACANVANLLLARGLARQREIAIRLSLGASRARVVRRLLTEALVLSAAAGAAGFACAFVAPRLMFASGFALGGPYGFVPVGDRAGILHASFYEPDASVFWLTTALAAFTAVLAGLLPALRATRLDLAIVAGERHGRTIAGGQAQFMMLGAQIALTTLLLAGAGLLTRAINNPSELTPGFSIAGVQSVTLSLPPGGVKRWKTFFLDLNEALKRTDLGPVAFGQFPPLSNTSYVMMARRPDEAPEVLHDILLRPVSRNYFSVLGIPILKGRVPGSNADSHEIVVNESAARQLWPHADPIGKTLLSAISETRFETCEVVGVVKDIPARSMSGVEPVIYRAPDFVSTVLLRSSSPGAAERVHALVRNLEPRVNVSSRPLIDDVRESLTMAAVGSKIAWIVGSLGLCLAMVGAFGVFAYAVEGRRREIAIRLALGASGGQLIAMLFRTAGRALLWGLVAGFGLAITAAPLLRQLLFDLRVVDPIAFAEVAGILAGAVALATWIPTRTALAVDAATTLRSD